jgi:cbb3-type cytochrome oxidase subunit 3
MMSEMARDFFGTDSFRSAPLVVMLLFFGIFVLAGVIAAVSKQEHMDRAASLPLEDGEG